MTGTALYLFVALTGGHAYVLDAHQTLADCGRNIAAGPVEFIQLSDTVTIYPDASTSYQCTPEGVGAILPASPAPVEPEPALPPTIIAGGVVRAAPAGDMDVTTIRVCGTNGLCSRTAISKPYHAPAVRPVIIKAK